MAEPEGAAPDDVWGARRPTAIPALCIGAIKSGLVHGALRHPLRKVMRSYGDAYDITVDGIKMRCWLGDNFTEQMLVERGLHKDRTGVMLITNDLPRGGVFVDIGANCGLFTLFAARAVGSRGRVMAIEPSPEMARRVRFNVETNGMDNVTVVQAAVGAHAGRATLFGGDHHGLASLCDAVGGAATTVPMAPLITLVAQAGLDRIDALKIDIEGYEDRALIPFVRGAPRALWPRRIFIEKGHAARWEEDCVGFLLKCGYREAWSSGADMLLELAA